MLTCLKYSKWEVYQIKHDSQIDISEEFVFTPCIFNFGVLFRNRFQPFYIHQRPVQHKIMFSIQSSFDSSVLFASNIRYHENYYFSKKLKKRLDFFVYIKLRDILFYLFQDIIFLSPFTFFAQIACVFSSRIRIMRYVGNRRRQDEN